MWQVWNHAQNYFAGFEPEWLESARLERESMLLGQKRLPRGW